MKKTHSLNFLPMKVLLSMLTFLFINKSVAQTQSVLYSRIVLNTSTNFTVNPQHDSSFVKEIILSLNDTSLFQNVKVKLSIKDGDTWNTVQSVTLLKPLTYINCNTPLCVYRKNATEWVINLGHYSTYQRHKVKLVFKNNINADWEQEF